MRLGLEPLVKENLDGELIVNGAMNLPKAQSQRLLKITSKSATGSDLGFLKGGDLALIIQLKGSKAGAYGKVAVKSVKGTTVEFMEPLKAFDQFGNPSSDLIVIQRVPYFSAVTVSAKGTLNIDSWDGKGTKTGILGKTKTNNVSFKKKTVNLTHLSRFCNFYFCMIALWMHLSGGFGDTFIYLQSLRQHTKRFIGAEISATISQSAFDALPSLNHHHFTIRI